MGKGNTMPRPDYPFPCDGCGKNEIGKDILTDAEKLGEAGWIVETDPPEGPGGYSVFRVYCPECVEKLGKGK